MARTVLPLKSMTPKPTVVNRLKQTFEALLAKLRNLVAVPHALQTVPIRKRPVEKDVERWRNEGGH